jgi:DNA replication protein DnaC
MLFGPVGTGKTHLATGIMRNVLAMGKTAVFWNWSDYIHNVKQTFNNGDSRADFDGLERAETADLLVLDDLGAARTTDFVDEELYWLVNRRYDLGKGIVVTSNLTPRMMREEIEAGKASSYFERAWSRVLGMSGKDGLLFLEGNDHRQEWGR